MEFDGYRQKQVREAHDLKRAILGFDVYQGPGRG